jgi:hypothetical protein
MSEQTSQVPIANLSHHDAILWLIPFILLIAGLSGALLVPSVELAFGVGGLLSAMLVGYGLFIRPPRN